MQTRTGFTSTTEFVHNANARFPDDPIDIAGAEQWLETEWGIGERYLCRLNIQPSFMDLHTLLFPADTKSDTREGIEKAELLIQHFAKAVEISRPFLLLKARFQATLDVVDRFHLEVLILTPSGKVALRNTAEETLARNEFTVTCIAAPVDCYQHRGQWRCASAVQSLISVMTEPDVLDFDDESPFVDGLSLVAQWNELALAAIRSGKAKPTITAYQLFMLSTAMYDVYAAFEDVPVPYALDAALEPGADLRNGQSLDEALSQAAYKSLVFLFPAYENRYGYFLQYLTSLGFQPVSGYETNAAGPDRASGIGFLAVAAFIEERQFDGSNFRNNFDEGPSMIYPEPYTPVNSPDPISETGVLGSDFNPNRWQPLRVPNGTLVDAEDIPVIDDLNLDSFGDQQFLSPHWGAVTPFALSHGVEFRPTPPPMLWL